MLRHHTTLTPILIIIIRYHGMMHTSMHGPPNATKVLIKLSGSVKYPDA
jgi:hypothetical protein